MWSAVCVQYLMNAEKGEGCFLSCLAMLARKMFQNTLRLPDELKYKKGGGRLVQNVILGASVKSRTRQLAPFIDYLLFSR